VVTLPSGKLNRSYVVLPQSSSIHGHDGRCVAHDSRKLAYMSSMTQESFRIGKLLFTPFSRLAEDGRYKAGLSIKRGQGSSTHDRVSIYVPTFTRIEEALIYARAMGNYESIGLATPA
jgi:hypothetical protein